jgi:L-alanine-DL-glutamate epimerase-like enolase superfamily enzyme
VATVELISEPLDLEFAEPFRIARGVRTHGYNVLVHLRDGEHEGIGEAAPTVYYGESRATVLAALEVYREQLGDDPGAVRSISERLARTLRHNASARASLDMALWDLLGQRVGLPVHRLLGIDPTGAPTTSFTIGIDEPITMARNAAKAARQFKALKIKVGTEHDDEIIQAIRDVTDLPLYVDANTAWEPKEALRHIERLAQHNVTLIEQPVAAHDLAGLRFVRERSPLPVFADESCVGPHDVARLAGVVDGINIKLMKCGGITPALDMIATARAQGMRIMLGCMGAESSVAITAAAQISPLVDYADLDAALLLKADPFEGVTLTQGKLTLPDAPGLGVRRR